MSKEYFEAKNTKQLCKILGLPESEAAKIEIRRDLVIAIKRTVDKNEWTHAEAAEEAEVGRTVMTAILNGHLERISTDRLIDIAHRIGLKLKLNVAWLGYDYSSLQALTQLSIRPCSLRSLSYTRFRALPVHSPSAGGRSFRFNSVLSSTTISLLKF